MSTVWEIAKAEDRDYITPEDITKALESGASAHVLVADVLNAIGCHSVEDVSLCAHLAWRALMTVPSQKDTP